MPTTTSNESRAALITGSYLAVSTAHSSAAAPTAPVTAPILQPTPPVDPPKPPDPTRRVLRMPVLADGRYNSYIRTVDRDHNQLVVDLVQVFDGQAAMDAAIADGMARDKAQYLGVYVRNQNPRLRTLPLADDLRLDLRGGDCEAPLNHELVNPYLLLHPYRARRRRAPGPGAPGYQRLLNCPAGPRARHGGAG